MGYKDPEKKRAYDRLRKQRVRAEQKLGQLTGGSAGARVVTSRTQTVTTRGVSRSLEEALTLEKFDNFGLGVGIKALEVAAEGLEHLDPARLNAADVKRLLEVGMALRNASAARIAERETVEESQVILTKDIIASDEAVAHVHALLRLGAAEDLDRFADGSSPGHHPGEGPESVEGDTGGVREGE